MKPPYLVVVENTEKAGGFKGIIAGYEFRGPDEFKTWYVGERRERYRVLAEGVTKERAVSFIRKTPPEALFTAALELATNRKTGKIDREKFIEEQEELEDLLLP